MNGNGLPFTSKDSDGEEFDINGEIVLLRTYLEDVTDYSTTIADSLFEEAMQKVYLQLVSTDKINQEMGEGKRGQEILISLDDPKDEYTRYNITFKWNVELGEPGALLVKNAYAREFFLKSLTLFAVLGELPALYFSAIPGSSLSTFSAKARGSSFRLRSLHRTQSDQKVVISKCHPIPTMFLRQ